MARKSYRQRRRYRGGNRWAPNIQEISSSITNIPTGAWSRDITLAFNPTQVATAVSQVYTVKNFEINFTFEMNQSSGTIPASIEDVTAYIMYVPQGMTVSQNYNNQHPEYIMAYKFIGSPSSDVDQSYQPFRIKTRLSRKLQSGDSVILFLKGNNVSQLEATGYELHGLVRWWTKAN